MRMNVVRVGWGWGMLGTAQMRRCATKAPLGEVGRHALAAREGAQLQLTHLPPGRWRPRWLGPGRVIPSLCPSPGSEGRRAGSVNVVRGAEMHWHTSPRDVKTTVGGRRAPSKQCHTAHL